MKITTAVQDLLSTVCLSNYLILYNARYCKGVRPTNAQHSTNNTVHWNIYLFRNLTRQRNLYLSKNAWKGFLHVLWYRLKHWGWDKMATISQTTLSSAFSWKKMSEFWFKISLKFVPKSPIDNIPALFQIMAWRRPGYKPFSEAMMVNLLTHICFARPQWVKIMYLLYRISTYRTITCAICGIWRIFDWIWIFALRSFGATVRHCIMTLVTHPPGLDRFYEIIKQEK